MRRPDPKDPDAEEERLMISTGGIWRAQDLLATLHDSTLRGLALDEESFATSRRSCSPAGRWT